MLMGIMLRVTYTHDHRRISVSNGTIAFSPGKLEI
jgi:hypothetical protein